MRKGRENLSCVFLVILLFSSLAAVLTVPGFASGAPRVYVDPSSIVDSALAPSQTFAINVTVADIANLFGFEYKIFWDSSLINVTSHVNYIPSGWESPNGLQVRNDWSVSGRHWYAYTALAGAPPFTGNFTLATYTFTVLSRGSCALDLDETKLVDNTATLIPHSTEDGYFDNRQSSSISISASPTTVEVGEDTTVSGSITPARVGVTVTVYYRLTGETWDTLTTVPTDATSQYSYVWAPTAAGTYEVKASWLGDSATLPAESSTVTITVEGPPPPPPALVFVDPPRIVNLTLVPCENFEINVSIIDAVYLYSFEFRLAFDPDILNVIDATLGNIFPPVTPTMEINNTAGYIWFSASLEPPEPEVSGNGTLAVITFHVEGLGACELTLSDTVITDSAENPLPHSTSGGYFNNVLLGKLAVDPPEIIDPTLMPPATFEINVTLADVEDLYGYAFNLSFNPDILACVGISIHDVLNETSYIPNFVADSTKGFLWVNVTYYPPAEPITTYSPVNLVTIKFLVKAMGATPLDLHDASLIDSLGQPIPHETFDGLVLILIRDVAVTNVVPSISETYVGYPVNVTVTVGNEGDMTETFNVSAYYNNDLIGKQTVTDLPSGENRTLIFTWNTAGVQPCINYTIKAEASVVPYETDTADNVYIDGKVKIKMFGDINGDGIIDINDIAIAALAFASAAEDDPETPWNETVKWNPEVDLNGDGNIDIIDLVIIGIRFGQTC